MTRGAGVTDGAPPVNRYLDRKRAELALVEQALARPPAPPRQLGLAALLKRKFKSAAQCRAQTAASQWSQTETKWKSGPCGSGAFHFDYAYQRADLSVEGPPAYPVRGLPRLFPTQFTTSGMAAMAATLLALQRLWPRCWFDVREDGYPETRELVSLLGGEGRRGRRIVILDSTVDTPKSVRDRLPDAAAAIFDTSCFAASSGRIGAIVAAARERAVPLVLVRSHTKLDCLGLDYGRLGSLVVAHGRAGGPEAALDTLLADFVRLTGLAALPLHFPPFAGGEEFRTLTRARTAWTIRSTRLIEQRMGRQPRLRRRSFAHGLFTAFFPEPAGYPDREAASQAAARLAERLTDAGIPARHAGSFGFDFFGCDWFEDPVSQRIGIRLSVGDLPWALVQRAWVVLQDWARDSYGGPHGWAERDGTVPPHEARRTGRHAAQ